MGGKGGSGSSGAVAMPNVQPSQYQEQLASMANNIYGSTAPLRSTFLTDWQNFLTPTKTLKSGASPTMIPQYSTVGATAGTPQGYIDPTTGNVITSGAPGFYMDGGQAYLRSPSYSFDSATGIQIPGETSYQLNPFGGSGGNPGTTQLTGYTPQYQESDYTYGKYNPADIPGYLPQYDIARRGLESQYNVAAGNAIAGTPRGGAMSDALNKINLARAESVGGLPNQISGNLIQDAMNKAYGAAFNAPSQAISGLSAASQGYTSTQNAMINAAMQQQALNQSASNSKGSGLGALGMGLGTIVGSVLGGPVGGAAGGMLGGLGGKGAGSTGGFNYKSSGNTPAGYPEYFA